MGCDIVVAGWVNTGFKKKQKDDWGFSPRYLMFLCALGSERKKEGALSRFYVAFWKQNKPSLEQYIQLQNSWQQATHFSYFPDPPCKTPCLKSTLGHCLV